MINYHLWHIKWKMLCKRHRGKSSTYLKEKYFTKVRNNKWILKSESSDGEEEMRLFQISYVPLKYHKICAFGNPDDPKDYEFFKKRVKSGVRKFLLIGRI